MVMLASAAMCLKQAERERLLTVTLEAALVSHHKEKDLHIHPASRRPYNHCCCQRDHCKAVQLSLGLYVHHEASH